MAKDPSTSSGRDPICGMDVDPEIAKFKAEKGGKTYYFCSGACRDKFLKAPFWKNKIFIMAVIYAIIFGLGYTVNFFAPLKDALLMYLHSIAFAILLGLFIGGVIDWLIPSEYVSAILAQKKKRTIIYSVLTGFLMSACSHGILALAIQLYKKGASVPAVIAFLLASPWANLPLTIIMFGFFGFKALFIIISAIVVALISGYIFMFLDRRKLIEHNPNTIQVAADFNVMSDAKERLKQVKVNKATALNGVKSVWAGSLSLANMVLWWIMLGMLLASVVAAYLPPNFMQQYMGPTILGLIVTIIIATVLEICSEGTAPLSFEIYRQTGALGNSYVFLMAGVVTDYTEIGLLWTNIGWKTAVWLPIITVPQVILLGVLANIIF